MKEYNKIETLLERDEKFKVVSGKWRFPEFEYLKENEWLWTEKIDGTNIRIMWIPEVGKKVGGKTDNAQIPPFLLEKLEELFPDDKLRAIFPDTPVCLYGEGFGARIQKGGGLYNPSGVDYILFDVKIEEWWLERDNIEDIASKLGIKVVSILGKGNLSDAVKTTKEGHYSAFGNFIAEGIVVRPPVSLFNRRGHRIIGKIKTKDF